METHFRPAGSCRASTHRGAAGALSSPIPVDPPHQDTVMGQQREDAVHLSQRFIEQEEGRRRTHQLNADLLPGLNVHTCALMWQSVGNIATCCPMAAKPLRSTSAHYACCRSATSCMGKGQDRAGTAVQQVRVSALKAIDRPRKCEMAGHDCCAADRGHEQQSETVNACSPK